MADQSPEQVLDTIGAEVRACTACRLHEKRTKAVPGEGAIKSGIMFIGEGPGFHEDQQGRPFVGQAGKLLEEMLAAVGLRREQVFITNVVKCRPPGNRDPQPDEIAACNAFLERQLTAIAPRIVVTLGRYSLARFFPGAKISAVHGEPKFADGRAYVPFYHPAAGLRTPAIKQMLFEDIQKLPEIAKQLKELHEQGYFEQKQAETAEAAVSDEAAAADEPASDQLSLF
ncbi:MAG: uracil-DNA glycosylase [Chloroflexota bacterium]|nr:uracil-DNA glycosylase [Chloroflexota bacterium]